MVFSSRALPIFWVGWQFFKCSRPDQLVQLCFEGLVRPDEAECEPLRAALYLQDGWLRWLALAEFAGIMGVRGAADFLG
jgi:hypothetical protein